jgi:pimeloyl-ACP methyl ester carboxylesterase
MRIVLLPGMDGTGELFAPLLEKLPLAIKCAVISYEKDKKQSYKELVEYVHNLLPTNEDYIIVAESFSGPIAFELAKNNDPNLKSIIFVASFLSSPNPLLSVVKWLPLSILFKAPIPTQFVKKYLLGVEINDDLISKFRNILGEINTNVLSYRLRQMASLELGSHKLEVRAIYLQATDDKLVSENSFTNFKLSMENLRVILVPGPHFLLQANPTACAAIIEEECRELARTSN